MLKLRLLYNFDLSISLLLRNNTFFKTANLQKSYKILKNRGPLMIDLN